jgi:hypothetical protein
VLRESGCGRAPTRGARRPHRRRRPLPLNPPRSCTLHLDALRSAAARPAAAGARPPPAPAPAPARGANGAGYGSDWPHANNVAVSAVGLCNPAKWRDQLARGCVHSSLSRPACSLCGFRGHAAAACAVPRCRRCGRFGHDTPECGAACTNCGVAGGAPCAKCDGGPPQRGGAGCAMCGAARRALQGREPDERFFRNDHPAAECPFNRCRSCGRVGHYTDGARAEGGRPARALPKGAGRRGARAGGLGPEAFCAWGASRGGCRPWPPPACLPAGRRGSPRKGCS